MKEDFKDYICKPFCPYFRENSKEDMACQAAVLVAALASCGRLNATMLAGLDRGASFSGRHDDEVDETACAGCAFRKEDCDFQSMENRDQSEPCGGYKILALLKEKFPEQSC